MHSESDLDSQRRAYKAAVHLTRLLLAAFVLYFGVLTYVLFQQLAPSSTALPLWLIGVLVLAPFIGWWATRLTQWSILRKYQIRCVSCNTPLWVRSGLFSKPLARCISCGNLAFVPTSTLFPDQPPPKQRHLPWAIRSKKGITISYGVLGMAVGLATCIAFTLQNVPLGVVEWVFLVVGATLTGLLSGVMMWFFFIRPRLAELEWERKNASPKSES